MFGAEIHSGIHSSHTCLLGICYVLGIVLRTGDANVVQNLESEGDMR